MKDIPTGAGNFFPRRDIVMYCLVVIGFVRIGGLQWGFGGGMEISQRSIVW